MPAPKQNADRDQAIVAKHTLGMTFEAIGQEYGLTRQRVSQIIAAARPRSPGEAARSEVAATLRRKYDELQAIIDIGTPRSSAIGRVVCYPEGHERAGQIVNDDSVRIRAIAEQAKLMTQYRAMFGVDISQPPQAFILDARQQVMVQQVTLAQQQLDAQAPRPALAPLPPGYRDLPPEEQARIDLERRRAQVEAQRAVIQGQIID